MADFYVDTVVLLLLIIVFFKNIFFWIYWFLTKKIVVGKVVIRCDQLNFYVNTKPIVISAKKAKKFEKCWKIQLLCSCVPRNGIFFRLCRSIDTKCPPIGVCNCQIAIQFVILFFVAIAFTFSSLLFVHRKVVPMRWQSTKNDSMFNICGSDVAAVFLVGCPASHWHIQCTTLLHRFVFNIHSTIHFSLTSHYFPFKAAISAN